MTLQIKGDLGRYSAVERSGHLIGRNYLWHRQSAIMNAVLTTAGYNFRRLIRWLSLLLFDILDQLGINCGSCRPEI
ncbi:hypothetical protein [Bradyrhizobium sp. 188]|uniref:hypothetical protein n=1 Tax=Bradyrhizobium sp. 188 TaxID=2782656 RepID=UPI001FF7DE29|nr:hypothetical protein [Bradyrhizobium sp. 188]MCK1496720.1 hypothetical protein [Bradyrhizobium sp. 188]